MLTRHTEEQWSHWFDQLAATNWVQIDDFFPEAFLKELISFFEGNASRFEPAKIGSAQDEKRRTEIRSDYTFWLDKQRDVKINAFFVFIETLMERISRELFLGLQGYEFHFALYPAGGFYKPHVDQFDTRSNRMISFIIYLNENWVKGDGGELRIHQDNTFIDIEPICNRAVLFRSDTVLHEVLLASKPRRSITGWLLKRPSGVGVIGL